MMKTNKKIIVFVWGIIFLGAWGLKAQADDSSGMVDEQKELQGMMAASDAVESFVHKAWDTRNPFESNTPRPQVNATAPVIEINPDLVLQGVFLGSSKPSVIVNGTVLGIGDKLGENTVQEIKEDSVVLLDEGGNKKVLSLKK